MNNTVKEIAEALLSYNTITLITHIRPDGDTLGSAFALYNALLKLNKDVRIVCESEISPRYRFLSDGNATLHDSCEGKIVCVDIASPEMAGKTYCEIASNADIVIDHHPTNPHYGKMNLVRSDAAACGEIVFDIIQEICEIDKIIADCLYTAISTDTGCFVYSSTTDYTHTVASALIRAGADTITLNKLLFRTKSPVAFEIERRALDSLEYFFNNTVACMIIKYEWIKELGATEDDIEGLSSVPVEIEGIEASATFRQIGNNEYKLSVRSSGKTDVSAVCKSFGGGGHKMAAGCTLQGDYDELKQIMAKKLYEGRQ